MGLDARSLVSLVDVTGNASTVAHLVALRPSSRSDADCAHRHLWRVLRLWLEDRGLVKFLDRPDAVAQFCGVPFREVESWINSHGDSFLPVLGHVRKKMRSERQGGRGRAPCGVVGERVRNGVGQKENPKNRAERSCG